MHVHSIAACVWTVLLLLLSALGAPSAADEAYGDETAAAIARGFAWHSYLEINPDIWKAGVSTIDLFDRFNRSTGNSSFSHSVMLPKGDSWQGAWTKYNAYKKTTISSVGKGNLIIYHVEDLGLNENAVDLTMNNIKVFVAAVLHHSTGSKQEAFFLFNVASATSNPARQLIPSHLPNVAVVDWTYSPSATVSFMQTLRLMDTETISSADAVFCLSSGVRGPLVHFQKGEWIDEFRRLLDLNGVGIVGSMINCEGSPHVQSHAFAIRSALVPQLKLETDKYYAMDTHEPMEDYFRERLTRAVHESNFLMASVYHSRKYGSDLFSLNSCREVQLRNQSLPSSCTLHPSDTIFLRWSGESLGAQGFMCGKGIAMNHRNQALVAEYTAAALTAPLKSGKPLPDTLRPVLPEVATGGVLGDLYTEFDAEFWQDRRLVGAQLAAPKQLRRPVKPLDNVDDLVADTIDNTPLPPDSKVCFLVRTAKMHDPTYVSPKAGKIRYVNMDLEVFARSLIMQTNRNWLAYFIITDPSPFEKRLAQLLDSFNDPRLMYFDVSLKYRPVFTVVDAGYTTTDYVMDQLLQRKECKWLSATNGDNAYGSEVVDRILNVPPMQNSKTAAQPDMLLLPMDSRNFADQEYILRSDSAWNRRCVGIEATSAFNQLASTAGSLPKVARVDLAAIVLNRQKLLSENVKFGNFSDPARFRCLGCNDGYFTQYLVRNRGWTYARLPLDGLRSLMFHGPSPTHCIAAGNIWFDHPRVDKVGCVSHETVYKILKRDARRNKTQRFFDVKHFTENDKICLRLNQNGFTAQMNVFRRRLEETTAVSAQLAIAPPGPIVPQSELSDDPKVFIKRHPRDDRPLTTCNWKFYLTMYPDLVQQNITTEIAAWHYEQSGKAEKRECLFSWKHYLWLNPDLVEAGVVTEEQAMGHYICCGRVEGRIFRPVDGFDWIAYLETNGDLYKNKIETKYDAVIHYRNSGKQEFRPFVATTPKAATWENAMSKFRTFLGGVAGKTGKRNLVVYHVEDIGSSDNAFDLTINNVKVFITALLHHDSSSDQEAFYWFNVAGLMDNPSRHLIPAHLPNVAIVDWIYASSSFNSFVQTVRNFDAPLLSAFDAVFSLSSGVRGPLQQYEHGAWIAEYRKLLDANNVGLVGPVISCEGGPHVINHVFAIPSKLIPNILQELVPYYDVDIFVPLEDYFLKRLSGVVMEVGYNIASMLHARRLKVPFLNNSTTCVDPFPQSTDVQSSCAVHPSEVLFLRWSGESWGAKRFVCGKGIAMNERNREMVLELTRTMSTAPLSEKLPFNLKPVLPEAPTGWLIYEEYNKELAVKPNSAGSVAQLAAADSEQSKVCFLVEVDAAQDSTSKATKKNDLYELSYVQDLIQTLSIQTNANWKAFFFSKNTAFEPHLDEIVRGFNDARLATMKAPAMSLNPKTELFKKLLQRKECKWLSATSGDNAYGSEVVDRILNAPPLQNSTVVADMLLAPLDSAELANRDYLKRGETGWRKRCVGTETMISLYQLSYTAQPLPKAGKVFDAAVFYSSKKLASELAPGNVSFPPLLYCPSCEQGYYTQYLVRSRGWTYTRLQLDGLKSIVFDGPSPTYCIAAGNVWFDHACQTRAGCLNYESIRRLQLSDTPGIPTNTSVFDWDRYHLSDQICLRFNKQGFARNQCGRKIRALI